MGWSWCWPTPSTARGAFSDDPEAARIKLDSLRRSDEFLGGFKTPSLRSVALTAPYMHGGHFETLEAIVDHYNEILELPLNGHREEILLPLGLDDGDVADLVAFLETLTGAPLDPALLER
jgi:cytochrome c peroxidase